MITNIYIQLLTVINNMSKKLILDTDDEFWKKVLKYKIDNNFKNNNEAVIDLIKKGLNDGKNTK